jgi:hypothetical protein
MEDGEALGFVGGGGDMDAAQPPVLFNVRDAMVASTSEKLYACTSDT